MVDAGGIALNLAVGVLSLFTGFKQGIVCLSQW